MSYLKDIELQIKKRDFSKFLLLWEEYCSDDNINPKEFINILKMIKGSDFALPFGKYIDLGVSLCEGIEDPEDAYQVLRLIIDLQTSNSQSFADKAIDALEKRYSKDPEFNERLRLIGLRPLGDFQGSLSHYELLAHMAVGKCVFHTGGWGTGEIVDLSAIREQLGVEFEYLSGRKYITFKNAFKSLIPLSDDHFLARRFMDPDDLEQEAKKDPVGVIKILLRDLGPLSAGEIKDELCELVIPEKEWTKWWQNARVKLKKDTLIETPSSLKQPFCLRSKEVTHEEQLHKKIHDAEDIASVIQTSYNYVRDFPNMLRKEDTKASIIEKLVNILSMDELQPSQELQVYIFLESLLNHQIESGKSVKEIIVLSKDIENLVNDIEIVAFKKRGLVAIKKYREDWKEIFISLLTKVSQSQLKDYLLKELCVDEVRPLLKEKLLKLQQQPTHAPETFVWYYQKLLSKNKTALPFSDKSGVCRFSEGFLILLHKLENNPEFKELTKKMYQILVNKRYETVRKVFEEADIQFIKEFLLLASKCHTLTNSDHKILHSLAKVVHSELGPEKKIHDRLQLDGRTIWTTQEAYHKTQEKAKRIGTVEIVENAREVEAARALGDLRENSEYKFAVEKRRQLQGELKRLSEELNRARVITEQDIDLEHIGIGSVVRIKEEQQEKQYTILGPWDADAEKNILSFQSQFAQMMIGKKVNDKFTFRDKEYQVVDIRSFLDV